MTVIAGVVTCHSYHGYTLYQRQRPRPGSLFTTDNTVPNKDIVGRLSLHEIMIDHSKTNHHELLIKTYHTIPFVAKPIVMNFSLRRILLFLVSTLICATAGFVMWGATAANAANGGHEESTTGGGAVEEDHYYYVTNRVLVEFGNPTIHWQSKGTDVQQPQEENAFSLQSLDV